MAHSIDSELLSYIDKLDAVQKKSLLDVVKSFLKAENPISVQQYNDEIDEAMIRMDAGKYISQQDLEKEAEQW
jgi:hypothetical protein